MPELLPLFPLGTVLFPGMVLPLRIFEPRYRTLVQRLVDQPEGSAREFGVVAIRQGWEVGTDAAHALYDYGCTASMRRVESYEDGGYDLVTVGNQRFRLGDVDNASEPYLVGSVDRLSEEFGDAASATVLAGSVRRLYTDYLTALAGKQQPEMELSVPDLPDEPMGLSHLVRAPGARRPARPARRLHRRGPAAG